MRRSKMIEDMRIEIFEGTTHQVKKQYDEWRKQCKADEQLIFIHHMNSNYDNDGTFYLTIGYIIV